MNIKNSLKELNDGNFEMMMSLLSKYFYREHKKCFNEDYSGYTIDDMLESLSEKSIENLCYQIDKCKQIENFNKMIDFVENRIKNKVENAECEKVEINEDEYSNIRVDENALLNVIESLRNNDIKEIIVTKCDDTLIVRYKS